MVLMMLMVQRMKIMMLVFIKKEMLFIDNTPRARPPASPSVVLGVVDLGLFGGELSGFRALFDFTHRCSIPFQGSPRKEKMIWICFGERSLRWGE